MSLANVRGLGLSLKINATILAFGLWGLSSTSKEPKYQQPKKPFWIFS